MLFGLNSGCGIDIKRYCFAYGKKFTNRPTLGLGIIIDGEDAYFERMLDRHLEMSECCAHCESDDCEMCEKHDTPECQCMCSRSQFSKNC